MLKKAHSHVIASQHHKSPTKQIQHKAHALEILEVLRDSNSFGTKRKHAGTKSTSMKKSRGMWVDTSSNKGESICKRLMSVGEGYTLEPQFIESRREAVHMQMDGKKTTADILTPESMYKMLDLYDKEFFSSRLLLTLKEMKCCLLICIDDTCTVCPEKDKKKAAYVACPADNKTQTIHMLTHKFVDLERRRGTVFEKHIYAGPNIRCRDILECIMLIFEHELVHALVGYFCPSLGFVRDTELDKLSQRSSVMPMYVPHSYRNHFEGINKKNTVLPHFAAVWNNWKKEAAHKGDVHPADGHSAIFMGILVNLFRHGGYRTYLGNTAREENPFIHRYIPGRGIIYGEWND